MDMRAIERPGRSQPEEKDEISQTVTTKLNDVDIGSVVSLVEKIRQEPHVADSKWSAEIKWKGGFRSEATVRDFAPSASDEPDQLGGTNTGPNPVEQVLGALGNCLAVGYAANATAAGISILMHLHSLDGTAFAGDRTGA